MRTIFVTYPGSLLVYWRKTAVVIKPSQMVLMATTVMSELDITVSLRLIWCSSSAAVTCDNFVDLMLILLDNGRGLLLQMITPSVASSQLYHLDGRNFIITMKFWYFVALFIENPTYGTRSNHSIWRRFFFYLIDNGSLFNSVRRWVQQLIQLPVIMIWIGTSIRKYIGTYQRKKWMTTRERLLMVRKG